MWFNKETDLDKVNALSIGLAKTLGIEFTAIDENSLQARMPVDDRTKQPLGLLHGGATAALAETMGSVGSHLVIDPKQFSAVGLEVSAQHIRSARSGFVRATAISVHLGRTIHVWEIKMHDNRDKLISICKLTVMVIKNK